MQNISRRNFLKSGGAGVAVGVVATTGAVIHPIDARADTGSATLPYTPTVIGEAGSLSPGVVVSFNYPDAASPCALVKVGEPTSGGVGPDGDIVAYSTLCSHMGCAVQYDADSSTFKCPCHYSIFDPSRGGQQVCGQATQALPQIELGYDASNDSISAIAVNGLIYGRQSNIV